MPFFQVVAETSEVLSGTHPDMVGHFTYVIVRKRPFDTLEEVTREASDDMRYPDAEMYAVEAGTSHDAATNFKQANRSMFPLVRKARH